MGSPMGFLSGIPVPSCPPDPRGPRASPVPPAPRASRAPPVPPVPLSPGSSGTAGIPGPSCPPAARRGGAGCCRWRCRCRPRSLRRHNALLRSEMGANYSKHTCPPEENRRQTPPTPKFPCVCVRMPRTGLRVGRRGGSAAVTLCSVHAFPRATATGIPPSLPSPPLLVPSSLSLPLPSPPDPTSERAASSLLSDEAVS